MLRVDYLRWDGTLADTTAPIIATMQAAFEILIGFRCPPTNCPFIGYSLARIVESLAPNLGEETREKSCALMPATI